MYMINLETVNILKGLDWSSVNERTFYHTTTDEDLFKKVTGIDIPTVKKLNAEKELSCQFCYSKDTDDKITFTASVVLVDETTVWEQIENCANDLLEMFSKEEPAETDTLKEFLEEDAEDIANKIKELDPEKYNEIELYILDNLEEHQKEDIAKEWIGENSEDAWDEVMDVTAEYKVRDFIKDYINDNL